MLRQEKVHENVEINFDYFYLFASQKLYFATEN